MLLFLKKHTASLVFVKFRGMVEKKFRAGGYFPKKVTKNMFLKGICTLSIIKIGLC